MIRRHFLSTLGVGSLAAWAGRTRVRAAAPPPRPEVKVGPIDLDEIPMIDTHVHLPQRMTLKQSYDMWNGSFVDAMVPDYDYPGKAELRARIEQEFIRQIWDLPRQTGYNNYMARVHGVAPTLEGFDSVIQRHIGSDAAFSAYIGSILDRERIGRVVLQSGEAAPAVPVTFVPGDRFVWTCPIVPMIHPEWAVTAGHRSLQDVVAAMEHVMEGAVGNGCVGFKNAAAYFRPLGVAPVEVKAAEAAFTALRGATPAGHVAQNAPYYANAALDAALRTYQDYLLKRVFVKAGELDRPVIIHTAVALHPALRFEFNNPLPLYEVFQDNDVRKAATRFVLIHTGYPNHHGVAAMLSQFPNVFADMSFYSKFPGVLEETYRAFLALAPSEKIMHGSDSNNVPEEIGYCASNTRRVLARVLNDYRTHYGWTDDDVRRMATNVMHGTAMRVFGIAKI